EARNHTVLVLRDPAAVLVHASLVRFLDHGRARHADVMRGMRQALVPLQAERRIGTAEFHLLFVAAMGTRPPTPALIGTQPRAIDRAALDRARRNLDDLDVGE